MSNLVTIKQAAALREIGYKEPTIRYAYDFEANNNYRLQKDIKYLTAWKKIKLVLPIPTVDEVIDWFRRKHHIMIYNYAEPFVDPAENQILYCYRVKRCNIKWGWNHREYIGSKVLKSNIYAAKRIAIWTAIRYVKKQKANVKRR